MNTKLSIDDDLIVEARKVSGDLSSVEVVHAALREYIERRKQMRIVDLFGKVDFDSTSHVPKRRRRS